MQWSRGTCWPAPPCCAIHVGPGRCGERVIAGGQPLGQNARVRKRLGAGQVAMSP